MDLKNQSKFNPIRKSPISNGASKGILAPYRTKGSGAVSTLIGILIIVVFAVFAGGILVWQYFKPEVKIPQKEAAPVKEEVKEEVNEPEEKLQDETVDWQTYRNEEYGFEVRYPQGVEIKESDYSEVGAIRFSVDFGEISNNKSVKVVVQNQDMEGVMREAVNIQTETEIIVDGIPGNRIVEIDQRGFSVSEIWVKNQKRIYIIKGDGQVFNQMLSSFRFLE